MTVGVCPYCGAKLNPGLKFCVLCGRHITGDNRGLGGLKQGLRPSDITLRLAEIMTVGRFKHSRRNVGFERAMRRSYRFVFAFISNFVICFALLYVLVQMSLEMVDPERAAQTRIPLTKIASFVDDKVGHYIPSSWSDKIKEVGKMADKSGSSQPKQPSQASKKKASKHSGKKRRVRRIR